MWGDNWAKKLIFKHFFVFLLTRNLYLAWRELAAEGRCPGARSRSRVTDQAAGSTEGWKWKLMWKSPSTRWKGKLGPQVTESEDLHDPSWGHWCSSWRVDSQAEDTWCCSLLPDIAAWKMIVCTFPFPPPFICVTCLKLVSSLLACLALAHLIICDTEPGSNRMKNLEGTWFWATWSKTEVLMDDLKHKGNWRMAQK